MSKSIDRILFVDDEPAILDSFRRQLRKKYNLSLAQGPAEGLATLSADGPFAIVVSDYQMPEMNGVEFLSRVRKESPHTVRIMLTGQADWAATIRAVNEGSIFRFLTKPCDPETLQIALEDGLKQWRLIHAERELLQRTLAGSIKVLTDVLSLVNPAAFSRSQRVKSAVERYAPMIGLVDAWQVSLAAMLSQIGCVTLPSDLLERLASGTQLTRQEQQMFKDHPGVGREVLGKIPRLGEIAEIVGRQLDPVDADSATQPPHERLPAVAGGQLLRIALDMDTYVMQGMTESAALASLRQRPTEYCSIMVDAIRGNLGDDTAEVSVIELPVDDVSINMVLAENVFLSDGVLLVAKGQEISEIVLQRMKNFAHQGLLEDMVRVFQHTSRNADPPAEAQLEPVRH